MYTWGKKGTTHVHVYTCTCNVFATTAYMYYGATCTSSSFAGVWLRCLLILGRLDGAVRTSSRRSPSRTRESEESRRSLWPLGRGGGGRERNKKERKRQKKSCDIYQLKILILMLQKTPNYVSIILTSKCDLLKADRRPNRRCKASRPYWCSPSWKREIWLAHVRIMCLHSDPDYAITTWPVTWHDCAQ